MLIKADSSQLEWRVKIWQSQDPVGIKEILNDFDIHTDNQKQFGLPSRLIAKIFVYRMIFADAFGDRGYAGPAYAYSKDSDFMQASESPKFWENVVTRFFAKYEGVREHSLWCIRTAINEGRITLPTGRFYTFEQKKDRKGKLYWPHTEILNYPVQGFAAEYMKQVRLLFWHRMKQKGWQNNPLVKLICTVHDDLQKDVDNDPELVYNICTELVKCFEEAPRLFEKNYGFKLNIPMAGEVKFGKTLYEPDMTKFNPKTFEEDFKNAIQR